MQANNKEAVKQTGQKRADIITAIVLIAFAVFIIVNAVHMKIMQQYAPGPGFFPLLLGILLIILSLGILWQGIDPKKADKKTAFASKERTLSSVKLILGLAVYAAVLETLGYIIATFLLVLYIMLFVSKDKVKLSIITSLCITLLIFLIFQVGLQLHLPMGLLKF